MHSTLLTTLVDEKHIMRYLNSIAPAEYAQAHQLLTECIGFAILTAVLPFYPEEQHADILEAIAFGDVYIQKKWLQSQPAEVKISIKETVERIFLAL